MPTLLHWTKALTLAALAFLLPIKPLLLGAGCLIIFDLITGLVAARKAGTPITSAGIRRTVAKMLVYQLAIISGLILERMGGIDAPVAKLVATAIAFSELKSILENAEIATGAPIVKTILTKLGSVNDK